MTATRQTPWTRTDAVAVAVPMAIGGVVWFSGWWEVSDRPSLGAQIAPMNVATFGLMLIAVGQALWFLRGRRAVGERRRLVLGAGAPPRPAVPTVVTGADAFVGSERFYHRLVCAMVVDRTWTPTSRAAHERAGRVPCGVCAP